MKLKEHFWVTASVLQSTFLIKLYQPEENTTVGQISEKDIQCFLCFMFFTLHFLEKNKNKHK